MRRLILAASLTATAVAFPTSTVQWQPVRALQMASGHLSAGSSLSRTTSHWLVLADDELHLGQFPIDSSASGEWVPLLPDAALPAEPKARKLAKPDLESAVLDPGGWWLAFGSGSAPNRCRGVCAPVDGEGRLQSAKLLTFDLTPLYASLQQHYPLLNIEGAALVGDGSRLRMAQRGNGVGGINALIDLDWTQALARARTGQAWTPELVLSQRRVELPTWDGRVALTLTDLAALPEAMRADGACLFAAAAEDTLDPIQDGPTLGSVVGVLHADGSVGRCWRVLPAMKLEGLWAAPPEPGSSAWLQVWGVNDPDDPSQTSTLWRAELPADAP